MKQSTQRAAKQLRRDVKKQLRETGRSRKDAVIHLRIEHEIVKRIKEEAKACKMSVSDLVRRHLVELFPASEDGPATPAFLAATFAWVDVVAAQETRCAKCGKGLPAQSRGWLAQGPPPPTRIVCGTCYDGFQAEIHDSRTSGTEEETDGNR